MRLNTQAGCPSGWPVFLFRSVPVLSRVLSTGTSATRFEGSGQAHCLQVFEADLEALERVPLAAVLFDGKPSGSSFPSGFKDSGPV